MKFTAAFLLLVVACCANASIIPGLVGTHLGGPIVLGPSGPAAITVAATPLHHASLISHSVLGGHVVTGPGPVQVVSGPAAIAAPAVVAAAHGVVPGAVHVAKTRGAVHVAPLAGHIQSVVSANLQPAPGTL